MRLLLVTSGPLDVSRGSGTAMAVSRLRAALRAADVSVPVLAPRRRGRSGTLGRWRFNRSLRARDLNRFDAVLGIDGDAWRVAAALEVPFIALIKAQYSRALAWERGATAVALRVHARWERAGALAADCVVAPSRYAADAVIQDYGVGAARVRVIPEPFPLDEWRAELPARERTGRRVLCVAHLYPRKRVSELIDAWPLVARERPDARLDIVGDGPQLRDLTRRAAGMRTVFMHGHVEHPSILEYYARSDSFCLPSAQETFGYAAVEAMASGLPLVVAAVGALPEVAQGAVAESVPVGNAPALANAVLWSLDTQVRDRAAAVNPGCAAAFDPRAVARQLIDAVNELR